MKKLISTIWVLSLLFTLACDNSDDPIDNPVAGTWRIVSIQVSQDALALLTPPDERITIAFEADGTFTGTTSVNQFSGRYEFENVTLTMLEFATTEVADTTFGNAFYQSITAAQVPNTTTAQFGVSFENQDLQLVFGNSGLMILERE